MLFRSAAHSATGPSFAHMIAVALRHAFISPWPTLNPTFLVLGLATLALQLRAYRGSFSARGAQACQHFLVSIIFLVIASAALGAIIALPLRMLVE